MGMSTMTLARKIVRTACDQFMPPLMSEEASMYVVMQADMEIHRAAKLKTPHLRRDKGTGAKSALHDRLWAISASTSGALAKRPDDATSIVRSNYKFPCQYCRFKRNAPGEATGIPLIHPKLFQALPQVIVHGVEDLRIEGTLWPRGVRSIMNVSSLPSPARRWRKTVI